MKASALWATGDLQAVEPLLANPGTDPDVRGMQALFQRRYAAAIEIFSSEVAAKTKRGEPSDERKISSSFESATRRRCRRGARDLPKRGAGSSARAREGRAGFFCRGGAHAALGLAYAGLGEAASAIAEGQKAMAMYPTSKDPWMVPG